MSKKVLTPEQAGSGTASRKLRTKELIYAGALGALYIVLMMVIVMSFGMVPILYIIAPIVVGLVCGTVYLLCVLKVRKFGAALILGILFALMTANGGLWSICGVIGSALLAELVMLLGKYKSKFMYLLSFVFFNLNMACPYLALVTAKDAFIQRSREYYGDKYAEGIAALATDWIWFAILGFAILGGILGALVANKLIRKHFEKAGVV